MLDPSTTTFLYWFARMARLTTADVEVRHARNNTSAGKNGDTEFSGIAAQYVNAEYSELRRAAVVVAHTSRSLQAPPERVEGPMLQGVVPGGDDATLARAGHERGAAEPARPHKRGKSALHCFRDDRPLPGLKDAVVACAS